MNVNLPNELVICLGYYMSDGGKILKNNKNLYPTEMLSLNQQKVERLVDEGYNVFITEKGRCGKLFFLRYIICFINMFLATTPFLATCYVEIF